MNSVPATPKMSIIVGIDLGTTNTCCAYFRNDKLEFLRDESGSTVTPSIVTFDDKDMSVVGKDAIGIAHLHPRETIYEVKRLIGYKYDDPKIQGDLEKLTYEVGDFLGNAKIKIRDNTYYPEEISAFVLEHVVDICRDQLKLKVDEAIITVPAYFGTQQREATKDAAVLAGITKVHIINEPTAAALAYQDSDLRKFNRKILVFDFGGGTFDVSVVNTCDSHCEVIGIDGDCHLGGSDVDRNVLQFVLEKLREKYDFVVNDNDVKVLRRLRVACEDAKKMLSKQDIYEFSFSQLIPNADDYSIDITRKQFDEMNDELFTKTIDIVEKCLADIKLNVKDIDVVVLVGGSTRIPKVRKLLRELFGDKVNTSKDPDQMVAHGAAIYARNISNPTKELTFKDVLTFSLGTDSDKINMSKILTKNSQLPCSGCKIYEVTSILQKKMSIKIYEGEDVDVRSNTLVGEVVLKNLRGYFVEVTFTVDAEGILKVSAEEIVGINKISAIVYLNNPKKKMEIVEKVAKRSNPQALWNGITSIVCRVFSPESEKREYC